MSFETRTRTAALTSLPAGPLAFAVIDVDGFDLVNDQQGFDEGDRVLGLVEDALLAGLPGGSTLGHVKGDEWRVVMPDATPEELLVVLDGIRRQLASEGPVTIAGGVAGRPQHGETLEDLSAAADAAQTRAKDGGGNRIAIAAEEKMVLKSSYYTRAALRRLNKLAERTRETEASHLRAALDAHLAAHRELV